MSGAKKAFEINDKLNVVDNLAVYSEALKAIDEQLGAKLSDHLPQLMKGQDLDTPTIWNSLYEVIVPAADIAVEVPQDAAKGEGEPE
jgi:hypothetical protein